MLASISPLGERARQNRWWLTVSYYLAASSAAGAAVGAAAAGLGDIAGLSGPWLSTSSRLMAATLCLIAAGSDITGRVLPPRRQVDEGWLDRYRRWVYAWGFGAQLGAGLMTVVTSAAVPLTFALALLSARPDLGAFIGAAYGLARALPVLALVRVRHPSQLRRFHQRLATAAPVARWTTVAALLGAAAITATA
jgi:hypothetical protein